MTIEELNARRKALQLEIEDIQDLIAASNVPENLDRLHRRLNRTIGELLWIDDKLIDATIPTIYIPIGDGK